MHHERYTSAMVVTIAALFMAVTTRFASFAATIADASGYVSEATRWLRSDLFVPQPFAFWPAWPAFSAVPLGYRLGSIVGTDAFTYPPGLPMTMAAAMALGGELAAYLVPPVLGGMLVWAAGDLAARLAGPRARVMAALLMATSAIALLMAAQPMSDVPAAAWWTFSLALAVRGRAVATLATGLAVSMAILTRPNLAPLAVIPALLVVASAPGRRILLGGLFSAAALIGPAVLMWLQYILYGSPWASGHLGIEQRFSFANVPHNLLAYLNWYAEAHTPIALLAVLAPVAFWRRREPAQATPGVSHRLLALSLLAVVLCVYAAYLPYATETDWAFVRFMLPALASLNALTAAVLVRGIDRLPRTTQTPALALVLVLVAGIQAKEAHERGLTNLSRDTARVPTAGRYLDEVLPPNAVVVTVFHSGSIRHYTERPILRMDYVPADMLDPMLARLEVGGYHPYLLIDDWLERAGFMAHFASSRAGALDWAPRAQIGGERGRIHLYDLADRERHLRGEQWPIDILQ